MKNLMIMLLSLLLTLPALSKARFLSSSEMIQAADAIAIVTVTSTESSEQRGQSWTYKQKVEVKTERVLKGRLDDTFIVFAEKNFECAKASFKGGQYLVFLKKDSAGLLVSVNHQLGAVPINDGMVQWSSQGPYETAAYTLLSKVVDGILAKVSKAPRAKVPSTLVHLR